MHARSGAKLLALGDGGICKTEGLGGNQGGRMAGELGFEPRLAESESAVLPLDDPPMVFELLSRLAAAAAR